MPHHDPEGRKRGGERMRERKMRQERERGEGRERGENERHVHPRVKETKHLIIQPINFGSCGSCAYAPKLYFPAQLSKHTHTPQGGLLLKGEAFWASGLPLISTNLHSNIWPTKDYWTFEKNRKVIKRKTRIKKTD